MSHYAHNPSFSRLANDQRVKAFKLSKSSKIFNDEELSQLSSLPISPVYSQMVIKLVQKINQKAEKVTQSPQKSRVDNTSACDSEGQILKNLKERTRETLQFQSSPNNLRPATKKTKKRIPTFTSQTSTSYQLKKAENRIKLKRMDSGNFVSPLRKKPFSYTDSGRSSGAYGTPHETSPDESGQDLKNFIETMQSRRNRSLASKLSILSSPKNTSKAESPQNSSLTLSSVKSPMKLEKSPAEDRKIEKDGLEVSNPNPSLDYLPYGHFGRDSPSNSLAQSRKNGVSVEFHQKLYTSGNKRSISAIKSLDFEKRERKLSGIATTANEEEESDHDGSFMMPRIEITMKPKTREGSRGPNSEFSPGGSVRSTEHEHAKPSEISSMYGRKWTRVGSPINKPSGGMLNDKMLKKFRSQSVLDPVRRSVNPVSSNLPQTEKEAFSRYIEARNVKEGGGKILGREAYFELSSQVAINRIPLPRKVFTPTIRSSSKIRNISFNRSGVSSAIGCERTSKPHESSLGIFQNSIVQRRGKF
eukprot:CAMPEP_0114993194 /NCGR_PEP_ID=MMETSP0216-20121206/12387_1 /TAXON_ID=223996 /ORGANISM="Protocruzia adherens, Strain Boccale" /LENGTH=529 /DNA_ID=CAMNT_0002356795 /DNA_START=509 /DNA_END=2098 /DNA_ORIENTATION=+